MDTLIPKIIHYCWFGRNPLPESAQKCIASWRKFFPDYEIWQWSEEPLNENENEKNLYDKILGFDVNSIQYTREAYEAKKYAFVSDYARFWILHKYGGLYFDTDVEVIKSFEKIISKGAFMGMENDGKSNGLPIAINPGLGLGATPEMEIYQRILDGFHQIDFYTEDGAYNPYTMIPMVTQLFTSLGFKGTGDVECVADTYIYPQEYFNPFDDMTGKLNITPNTYSIHWYSKTWCDVSPQRVWLSRLLHRIFGLRLHEIKAFVRRMLNK